MAQILRMAKDHRSFILVPISICIVFILVHTILQRRPASPRWSLTYVKSDRRWSGDFPGLRIQRRKDEENQVVDAGDRFGWRGFDSGSSNGGGGGGGNGDPYDETTTMFFGKDSDADRMTEGVEDDDDDESGWLSRSPYIYHENEELQWLRSPVVQTGIKYISYYQPYDSTQKSFKACRYNMCAFAKNLSVADVVAFKASLIRDHGTPSFPRPRHQRWIMFTSDPASKNYNLDSREMKAQFNGTCTYRLDSDIKWTFGKLRKIQTPSRDYDKIYDSKEGLAAWFVSHCHTFGRREEYVRRMQKIFKVDVFGLCSNQSCGNFNHRQDDKTSCLPMLSRKYKFYLSFENAFCEDYVTEKFFKLFKKIDIIPVVRGGVDYSKLFPTGVYINAADFNSPEELAQHLVDLGNDKERYLRMLRKKSSWVFVPGGELKHCKFCEYAHTQKTEKYYSNLKEVFNGDYPHCWKPTDVI